MNRERRSNPPLHLEESPLILVLGVIRISPVLSMEAFIPQIQERLRDVYPRFGCSEARQIHWGPALQIGVTKKWVFSDKESRTAVSVTSNSIALQTTVYQTFDLFVDRLIQAAGIVGTTARVAESHRLGLRYIDFIRPAPPIRADELLSPVLRGFTKDDFHATEMFQRHEFQCRTPEGRLVVRSFEPADDSTLPLDLAGSDLPLTAQRSPGERVVVLDIDHFTEEPGDFDVAKISDRFWKLHDYCDIAFRAATTEEARRKVWRGVDVVRTAPHPQGASGS
jgi:uncharacterized protein (TIGR04255 family)